MPRNDDGTRPAMSDDRVSIVVRSSARPELADALQSIAAQTYRNFEVIVVNIWPTPHPPLPAVAASLPVRVVEQGRQLPRPLAGNAGLDAAAGDHVVFLDDDDLLDPDHLRLLVAASRADRNSIPFSGAQIFDDHGELLIVWPALPFGQLEIIERIRVQTSGPLIPRSLLDDGLRFDPELPIFEDWDFWIRLSQRLPFRPIAANSALARLGLGTSGTGVGANFDSERTARDSRPFHARWEAERVTLIAEFDDARGRAARAFADGDFEAAERACWDAQRLRIWDGPTFDDLSRIASQRGQQVPARRFADAAARARMLVPPSLTHDALLRLETHLRAGNAAAIAGDIVKAEAEFVAALALNDNDQTACNGLANLRIADGRIALAEDLLRRATLRGDRRYPLLLLKRGGLLEQLGRRDEAKALYTYLAQLAPRYAPVRDRLQALEIIAATA